jgi:hypothetical protein
MQAAQMDAGSGHEVHALVVDARQQEVVGRSFGTGDIGQHEIKSTVHHGSLLVHGAVVLAPFAVSPVSFLAPQREKSTPNQSAKKDLIWKFTQAPLATNT